MNDIQPGLLAMDGPEVVEASETFSVSDARLFRRIEIGGREVVSASIPAPPPGESDLKGHWWRSFLAGIIPTPSVVTGVELSTVDLFCGPGGLAVGFRQLCAEMGVGVVAEAIVDQDEEATRVYASNHRARIRSTDSVSSLVDYSLRGRGAMAEYLYPPEIIDNAMADLVGRVDVVLAGPPCQGHSNLNNRSRRDDRRNELYLTVPAVAVALQAPIVVIENVPAVIHDWSEVVPTARRLLEAEGYSVTDGMISADDLGWPQTRRRHFMVARKDAAPIPLSIIEAALRDDEPRSLWWAIGHWEDDVAPESPMTQETELSPVNQERIDWLFDNGKYELDLTERPESHRNGTSYTAVYGRMHAEAPAPTITTGFMTPGRGRYVHPTRKRVLTAKEAARLQGFPDDYTFVTDSGEVPSRGKLAKWIGDAVPMPLGYAAALAALGPNLP